MKSSQLTVRLVRRVRPVRLVRLWSLIFLVSLACSPLLAASSSGLWVGEVVLTKVNETVVGIGVSNRIVAPDPTNATPVGSPAYLRIIFHVDGQGQTRLLKSVAVLNKNATNPSPDIALVTDPALYPNFSSIGKRISAAAFDFGDSNAVAILDEVASAAAAAAASGANPTNAANQVLQKADIDALYSTFVHSTIFNNAAGGAAASAATGAANSKIASNPPPTVLAEAILAASNDSRVVTARTNALALQSALLLSDNRYLAAVQSLVTAAGGAAADSANSGETNFLVIGVPATNAARLAVTNAFSAASPASPAYNTFIASATFQSSATIAAGAAKAAADGASGALQSEKQALANAAALKALINANIFVAADSVVAHEVAMNGTIAPGGSLNGNIYLGASHPTNPFRHRRHPDHSIGYAVSRALSINFDSAAGTNAFRLAGFGVDRITGTYREEISGLRKPLGPDQNIGLITQGTITLDRLSLVDKLNQ